MNEFKLDKLIEYLKLREKLLGKYFGGVQHSSKASKDELLMLNGRRKEIQRLKSIIMNDSFDNSIRETLLDIDSVNAHNKAGKTQVMFLEPIKKGVIYNSISEDLFGNKIYPESENLFLKKNLSHNKYLNFKNEIRRQTRKLFKKRNVCELCHAKAKTQFHHLIYRQNLDRGDVQELCKPCHKIEDLKLWGKSQ